MSGGGVQPLSGKSGNTFGNLSPGQAQFISTASLAKPHANCRALHNIALIAPAPFDKWKG